MNRRGFVFLLFIAMSLPSNSVAATPSLLLEHVLTGVAVEGDNRVLDYALRVTPAPGDSVSCLALSLVPLSIATTEQVVLDAGDIPAGQSVELSFRLVTPAAAPAPAPADELLSWNGRSCDEFGSVTEFPAVSRLVEEDRP